MNDAATMRVAYTLEQLYHRVPGGSATAAVGVANALAQRRDVELLGIVGRHRVPVPHGMPQTPLHWLPVGRPLLYETWNRFRWPRIESVVAPVDVCHSTVAIPAATKLPHVVTIHDVAFVHHPERFTRRGVKVMTRGLQRCRAVDVITCPSDTTRSDLLELGFPEEQIHLIPWGVDQYPATTTEKDAARSRFQLPGEFVLFIGTNEPRKNLRRLVDAMANLDLPLVIAGSDGWGDQVGPSDDPRLRFVGLVQPALLRGLIASASVLAYPSLEEGFGLPILEAMVQATPVVTSRGTATETTAGGAAVLIDPYSVESIEAGLRQALADPDPYAQAGLVQAAQFTWEKSAELTVAAYRQAIANA